MNKKMSLRRLAVVLAVMSTLVVGLMGVPAAQAKNDPCAKMSGTVVLTYHNPDTIILHVIKGKVNAATTFTMTPTTTYTRNGVSTTFDGVKLGDTGYISYQAVYPSGTLLACAVVMTGP